MTSTPSTTFTTEEQKLFAKWKVSSVKCLFNFTMEIHSERILTRLSPRTSQTHILCGEVYDNFNSGGDK